MIDRAEKFEEKDYKEFFEWLLDKKVKINKESDISLVMTNEKPYIYYPDEIKQLFETSAMKRIGQITQLGTGILSHSTCSHTRLAHSKGAGNNFVRFYMNHFKNQEWRKENQSEEKRLEILANIVQMYTHDIGHNILSHALESLIESNRTHGETGAAHEILGKRILNENQEIVETLNSIHPKLLKTLNKVSKEDNNLRTLKEGNIDFDRLDFIVRDVLHFGENENRDLTDRIISNCKIEKVRVNGNTYEVPVFEYEALPDIEKFLEWRAENYDREYASNLRIALDNLSEYFCSTLSKSDYQCDLKTFINHCVEKGGDEIDLDEFLEWNDIRYYNEVIKIASDCEDENLKELAIDCLPNVEGLVNLAFDLLDLREEKLENLNDYEKEFYENVKKIVKEDCELKHKLNFGNKKIEFFDSVSKEDMIKMKEKLEMQGISNRKINSMIAWERKIKKYNKEEPVLIKGKNGGVYFLDEHPDRKMNLDDKYNYGILAIPFQMKENGFSDEEIVKVQSQFKEYNEKHLRKKQTFDSKEVYEKMDIVEKIKDEEER